MEFMIKDFLSVPKEYRDFDWLKSTLQAAVHLEFFTIPPYLTAMWSMKQTTGRAFESIQTIAFQEMAHMGMVCNLLTAIGEPPVINQPDLIPQYPCSMPGGVRPDLTIGLAKLSKTLVRDVFMEIEHPECAPVATGRGYTGTFDSIGEFYDAIIESLVTTNPPINGIKQHTAYFHGRAKLLQVNSIADAVKALLLIKTQGEGTAHGPQFDGSQTHIAHYYLFGEIANGKQIVFEDDQWAYAGADVVFSESDVHPMRAIPEGGYPGISDGFDKKYTAMLNKLQDAWTLDDEQAGQQSLLDAVTLMGGLGAAAQSLMTQPIPDGSGETYGPSFLFNNA